MQLACVAAVEMWLQMQQLLAPADTASWQVWGAVGCLCSPLQPTTCSMAACAKQNQVVCGRNQGHCGMLNAANHLSGCAAGGCCLQGTVASKGDMCSCQGLLWPMLQCFCLPRRHACDGPFPHQGLVPSLHYPPPPLSQG
jgi:hypothetical protein